jgi:hypothetical protein
MLLRRFNTTSSRINRIPKTTNILDIEGRKVFENYRNYSILARFRELSIHGISPVTPITSNFSQFLAVSFRRTFSNSQTSVYVLDLDELLKKKTLQRIQKLQNLKNWNTQIESSLYIASIIGDGDLSKLIKSNEIYNILDDIDIIISKYSYEIDIDKITDLCWCILDTALFYSDRELMQNTSDILAKMYNIVSFKKRLFYINRTNDMIRYVSFGTEQITVRYCGATLAISLVDTMNYKGNFIQVSAFKIYNDLITEWIKLLTEKEYYEIVLSKGKSLDKVYQSLRIKYETLRNAIIEKK